MRLRSAILSLCLLYNALATSVARQLHIVFVPTPHSKTHILGMAPLAETLAAAGHRVTLLEVDANHKKDDNYTTNGVHYLHMAISAPPETALFALMWIVNLRGWMLPAIYHAHNKLGKTLFLEHGPKVERILSSCDLAVLDEHYAPHAYALGRFANSLGIPYVILGTTQLFYSDFVFSGAGFSPISRTPMFADAPSESVYRPTHLLDRLHVGYNQVLEVLVQSTITEWIFLSSARLLSNAHQPVQFGSLFHDAALVMADSLDSLGWPSPNAPNLVSSSSACYGLSNDAQLDHELSRFVDDPTSNGTLYVAFGSLVQWGSAPSHIRNSIMGYLEKLSSYRIIFSYSLDDWKPPAHIKLMKWAPQKAILAHPTTKLFISHGGLKSFRESLCAGVPAIFMPLSAEQSYNAQLARENGFGRTLNKFNVDRSVIKDEMHEILDNSLRYKRRVQHWRRIYTDRILPELDRMAHLLKRVASGRRVSFERQGSAIGWMNFTYTPQLGLLAAVIFVLSR